MLSQGWHLEKVLPKTMCTELSLLTEAVINNFTSPSASLHAKFQAHYVTEQVHFSPLKQQV